MPTLSTRPAAALVALLIVLTTPADLSTPAYATTATLTCTGTSTITYQPGLTMIPKTMHYNEDDQFTPCTSTDATLTAGAASASADFPGASCNGLPELLEDPAYIIGWNNGHTSTIDLTFTDTIVLGTEQVTGIGTVVSGQFQSATATIIWTYPVLNPLQCLTPQGVTSQTGLIAAQIIHS